MLALGALVLAGCGGTPPGGDPGGKRLEELAGDAVFAARPDGATLVGTKRTKATYQKPGFTGGGWRGPSVEVTITSGASPVDVYRFYGARAEAAGWSPGASGSFGVTDRWTKTYPDGARATLLFSLLGNPPAGSAGTYLLSGGVAPVVGR